jgi:hypothetical protein
MITPSLTPTTELKRIALAVSMQPVQRRKKVFFLSFSSICSVILKDDADQLMALSTRAQEIERRQQLA